MSTYELINFKRGFLPLIILSLLSDSDMYGYQIVQEIARQSQGKFVTQEGSLYPVLYKLLEGQYITSYDTLVAKRMRRVCYHIEETGRQYLSQLLASYEEQMQGIDLLLKREMRNKVQ